MPKISELNEITSLYANDYFAVAHDIQGLPSTKKISTNSLADTLLTYANYANNTSAGVFKVGNNLTVNSTGFMSAATGGSLGQILVSSGTGSSSWMYNPGVDQLIIENYTTTYTASNTDNYIFCDPNDPGSITVTLPTSAPQGKEYNIKNLTGTPGVKYVTVTTDQPSKRYLENPETGQFVQSYIIANRGDLQSWIHDGDVYRHIGSQTGVPSFITSSNSYAQVVIKNSNNGINASSDLVIYSDTADYTVGNGPFIDMGIDSSNYSNTLYSAFEFNDAYVYTGNANMIVGVATGNTTIKFIAGNTDINSIKMTINSTSIAANTNTPFLADTLSVTNMKGPFASDGTAASGGVPVKGLYYDSSGIVHIRLT